MMDAHRHTFRLRPGMRRGLRTEVPLPTRLVSNEEFPALPQTAAQRQHTYAPLTRQTKEQIFGLNAARLFGVDVNAKRNEIPADYLTRMKMAYLDGGPAPSHRWYGWVAG